MPLSDSHPTGIDYHLEKRQSCLSVPSSIDLADTEFGAARENLFLWGGPEQRILRLTRHETHDARHFCCRLDPVERPFAEAHIARLALTDGFGQSLHRFLEGSFLVEAVALIEIDVVRSKPLQRSVELLDILGAG